MSVRTGLQVLVDDGCRALRGRSVGLVTNPTGALPDGTSAIEALRQAGVRVKALFGPEHGVRGDVPAGQYVASGKDKKTGLPVHSLYGPTRTPTAAMLRGLDTLVFDLQDIGARSYTYLSTLGGVLDAAGRHGLAVVVLDRPNPTGGVAVEGGPVRRGFVSFIGKYPVAYRHGLTLGEAARMLVGEGWVRRPELSVVGCQGWDRTALWPGTGLPWRPTSPNIPTIESALLYHATGILGELRAVSVGIGTDRPFGYVGAPGIDGARLANDAALPGFALTPTAWTPKKGVFAGRRCTGVRVALTAPDAALTRLNVALLRAWPGDPFAAGGTRLFDLSCGTDAVRAACRRGAREPDLWALFNDGAARFDRARQRYTL